MFSHFKKQLRFISHSQQIMASGNYPKLLSPDILPSNHTLQKVSYHRNAVSCNIYASAEATSSNTPNFKVDANTFRQSHRMNRRLKLQQAQTSPATVIPPQLQQAHSVSTQRNAYV